MESRQRDSIEISCLDEDGDEDTYDMPSLTPSSSGHTCQPSHVFGIYDECCELSTSEPTYNKVFNILNVVGGTLAAAHVACLSYWAFRTYLNRVGGILFLFQKMADGTLFVVIFTGVAFVYQHLAYFVFFCRVNSEMCDHPPREYWVIQRLFFSLLVVASPYLFVQICRTVGLAFMFAVYRHHTLTRVMSIEAMLDIFGNEIDGTFSRKMVKRYRNVRAFVQTWLEKNDEDVSEDLMIKAARIMRNLSPQPTADSPPTDNGEEGHRRNVSTTPTAAITFPVFHKRLIEIENNGLDTNDQESEERIRDIWKKITGYESREPSHDDADRELLRGTQKGTNDDKTELTEDNIRNMLYDLFFIRKELIHAMHTDHYILTFLSRMALFLLYPASFIAVTRIFGYENAFGTGVDLFKTYLLGASYMVTGFKDDVTFLFSMLTDRPFNLGDVLLIDGQTYKVRRFSMTHFYLDGPHHISVPSRHFASGNTVNLSKQGITDSLQIVFPLSVTENHVNRDKMYSILYDYQSRNDRDVSKSSIRCGWSAASDGNTKMMQCNWRYNFRIYDRSRLNWARADIRHHIISSLDAHLEHGFLKYHIAGGGGLSI